MKVNINFFTENLSYIIKGKRVLRKWIVKTIESEGKLAGEINVVVCDDEYLSELNYKYLKHNTLTDILTFPSVEEVGVVQGEIYLSLPRIRENAIIYNQTSEREFHRVMIHGVLHLIGYDDSTKREKNVMRQKEDFYLNVRI